MSTVVDGSSCARCGAVLEAGAAFCGTCGARAGASGVAAVPVGSGASHASTPAAPHEDAGWSLGADVDDAVAPVWRRLVALLADQLLALVVGGGATLAVLPAVRDGSVGALLVPGLVLLLLGAGQWIAEAVGGRTVGGALLGIRTVSVRTGRPAGLWAVLVRDVVQALGAVVAGIGVYVVAGSGAWDEGPEQRGWHDKAAGTLVLRARPVTPAMPASAPAVLAPAIPAPAIPAPVPGAEAPAAAAPVRDVPDDLPDSTIPTAPGLGELEHTHVGRWAAGAETADATALALVLDTGERVPLTGPGLIGRRPVPGAGTWAHLVRIDDPEQSVSSTHLEFWPAAGGLDVLDRGSTNGTVLIDPAGKPWSLPPGQPARVAAGWTLVLGRRRIAIDPVV
jgi:uncharacterized RDD family membrane protein YckC